MTTDRDEKRQTRFKEERIRAESIKRQADKTGKLIIANKCEITVGGARRELEALLDSIDRDVASWGQVADDPVDIPYVTGSLRTLRARIEELEPLNDAAARAIRTAIDLGDTYATGCLRRNAERGYKSLGANKQRTDSRKETLAAKYQGWIESAEKYRKREPNATLTAMAGDITLDRTKWRNITRVLSLHFSSE